MLPFNVTQGRCEQNREAMRIATVPCPNILYKQSKSNLGVRVEMGFVLFRWRWPHYYEAHEKKSKGYTFEMVPRLEFLDNCAFSLLQNTMQRVVVPRQLLCAWTWVTHSFLALESPITRWWAVVNGFWHVEAFMSHKTMSAGPLAYGSFKSNREILPAHNKSCQCKAKYFRYLNNMGIHLCMAHVLFLSGRSS